MRGCGGFAVSRLRRRVPRPDPALHRADAAAGSVLRGGLPGKSLQALRHRRRPRSKPLRRRRGHRPGHLRPAPAGPARALAQARHPPARHAGRPAVGRRRTVGKGSLRSDPRRRRQGVRSGPGKERAQGSLRTDHLRPVLLVGAAPGRARGAVRHHQLHGLGHAQAAFPDHAPQAAGDGQGHGHAAGRSVGPRPPAKHHRLVERRVRPHAPGAVGAAVERRARPLRPGFLRRG
jgi:hypothetical protein